MMSVSLNKRAPRKLKGRPKSSDAGLKSFEKPSWDNTISDLTVHKRTSGDEARRRAGRRNLEVARASGRSARTADGGQRSEERQEAMLHEMFASKGRLWSILARTDRTLSAVRTVISDNGKRVRAQPNITRAPGSSAEPYSGLPSHRAASPASASASGTDDEAPEKVSEEAPAPIATSAAMSNSGRGLSATAASRLPSSDPRGDTGGQADTGEDSLRLLAPALDRANRQIQEVGKLMDALTLELISTNERYEALAREFSTYKEKSEKRISTLEETVQKLQSGDPSVARGSSDFLLDLRTPLLPRTPDSQRSCDDSGEEGPVPCRADILARLEELQRQRDLAQSRLQAIANL